ncbi:MAG: zinc ribbon domain-containing protein [Deltaproteobacteria bacterium]|nr:MAG: zinc ribbon domain-containing protein [Deltaproteobacteria bacterium]
MPIYEYECNKCRKITESLQKFSDPPLTDCPQCSGKLNKLMSLNSFHLKGTGWYVTDYAGKKPGIESGKSANEEGTKEEKADKTKKSDTVKETD